MLDIDFFMKAHDLKRRLMSGEMKGKISRQELGARLESLRNPHPVVYNIETTNACNMLCKMCPRTTQMTRRVESLDAGLFRKVVKQLKPHTPELWSRWEKFVQAEYGIPPTAMSENHFFLHVIPRVIQMHGYGDPLLDKNMGQYVKILTEAGFDSYFSCNPSNIDLKRTVEMFESGLTYIKYSIETVNDYLHKEIRGEHSDFSSSRKKIMRLLELKKACGYKTTIIITMLNLNRPDQVEEFERLRQAFSGADVYIYLKSEDQLWYRGEYHKTSSIHWTEPCQHPWLSMTIKSNGEVAMCMEDFNNEIILGDVRKEALVDIWNGAKYGKFRREHVDSAPGIKCSQRCDMKMVGDLVGQAVVYE